MNPQDRIDCNCRRLSQLLCYTIFGEALDKRAPTEAVSSDVVGTPHTNSPRDNRGGMAKGRTDIRTLLKGWVGGCFYFRGFVFLFLLLTQDSIPRLLG